MALIVEDGTGKPDAESYASVAAADAYHVGRANTAWAALDTAAKEVNLRKATDYMLEQYSGSWRGDRVLSTQALDWPRANATLDGYLLASNIVPKEVIRACCELALKASAGPLTVDETAQVKSETVGPLSTTYADGARQQTKYAAVDNLLRQLLASGSGSIRLVRA